MYGSSAWSPCLRRDVNLVERVQRRYTKCIGGLHELSYNERLHQLGVLSLENRRAYADLVFAYKALHGLLSGPSEDLGLAFVTSQTRGNGLALQQRRLISRSSSALFAWRVPPMWNRLPSSVASCRTLGSFKNAVFNHLRTAETRLC